MENQPGIPLKSKPYIPDCVKWNQDGQICICLDNAVHIITPVLCSVSSSKQETYTHVGLALPVFTKEADLTKIDDPNNVQTSYLNEEGFRCAIWSPFGISTSQSCLLTVVTTKHRVLLYQGSAKDPINLDWQLYKDITDDIKASAITHDYNMSINGHHTLYASWSSRLIPDPISSKPALLALTNKAGDICIWKYSTHTGIEYIDTVSPHRSFVNLVQWTGWRQKDEKTYIAYIVSSCTDGTVALSSVEVEVSVDSLKNTTIDSIKTNIIQTWFNDNASFCNFIRINDNLESDCTFIKIAISKGTIIYFYQVLIDKDGNTAEEVPPTNSNWSTFDMTDSALGLVSGDWFNSSQLRCYTMEGQGYQFTYNENSLLLDQDAIRDLNQTLVLKYKQEWMEEQIKVDDDELISSSDAFPIVWGTSDALNHTFTSIFFTMRAMADLHCKSESLEEDVFAFILQKPRQTDSEAICNKLVESINNPNYFFVEPMIGHLREMLQYLVDDEDPAGFIRWTKILIENMDNLEKTNFTRSIYSEPVTIAARIVINMELQLQHYTLFSFYEEFENTCRKAKVLIQIHYLSYVLFYVLSISDDEFSLLSDQDVETVLLLVDYSINLGDKSLIQQALETYIRLQDQFSYLELSKEIGYTSSFTSVEVNTFTTQPREKCPVCDELVKSIDRGLMAQCAAGHFWELCSITRRVLYKPNSRKCITCGAKSLQPTNDGSLTDTILKFCWKCLYCGSGLLNSK